MLEGTLYPAVGIALLEQSPLHFRSVSLRGKSYTDSGTQVIADVFLSRLSDSSCLVLRTCEIRAKQSGIGIRDLDQMFQDRSTLPWDACAFGHRGVKGIFPGEGDACLV